MVTLTSAWRRSPPPSMARLALRGICSLLALPAVPQTVRYLQLPPRLRHPHLPRRRKRHLRSKDFPSNFSTLESSRCPLSANGTPPSPPLSRMEFLCRRVCSLRIERRPPPIFAWPKSLPLPLPITVP